ncbi:hypothetical protein [Marinactinospora rubrisoli]|uniref:Uncharacterized protein n=1 Tax=Marinactinospora rubrisoli TaxID=2715399 RepID=A0ABW2KBZ4_9ACTN
MTAAVVLADSQVAADTVTPGVLGFLACAFVGFALYFLMKNMRKQMARIDFDEGPAESGDGRAAARPAASGAAAEAGHHDGASPADGDGRGPA